MKAALVIMAAGMGSRYGGSKQVDGIGPDGEILMEYSIYDAIRAGFTKVVFIIKPEMRELVETLCGRRVAGMTAADGSPVEVCSRPIRKNSNLRIPRFSWLVYFPKKIPEAENSKELLKVRGMNGG